VAYDNYIGRGVRRSHLEDYAKYIEGSDIISFDIYPVTHETREIAGNLYFVPKGVDRLRAWSKDQKIVWNCIECTRISNENTKPTPHQVKAEVWMSIIHGSRGLIYFCHQFKPTFIEAGLLADEEMAAGVGTINAQIHSLAAVLNSPMQANRASVSSSNASVPIDMLCKSHDGAAYIFAAAMRDGETAGSFEVQGVKGESKVEVLGEARNLICHDGKFTDVFKGYDVHLYKLGRD